MAEPPGGKRPTLTSRRSRSASRGSIVPPTVVRPQRASWRRNTRHGHPKSARRWFQPAPWAPLRPHPTCATPPAWPAGWPMTAGSGATTPSWRDGSRSTARNTASGGLPKRNNLRKYAGLYLRARPRMRRLVSSPCEPPHEELERGEVDQRDGGGAGRLDVLGEAPVTAEPRAGPPDHPPTRQDGEAARGGSAGDDLPPQAFLGGGAGRGRRARPGAGRSTRRSRAGYGCAAAWQFHNF